LPFCDAGPVNHDAAPDDAASPSSSGGYRRSAGTPRAQARRRELLELVTDDLAANGLVDFSLRRAAKAAGTTHKVLLYHFDGAEDLLRQAVELLRERRVASSLAAAFDPGHGQSLAERVRAVWPVLTGSGEGQRALDQALGLAMYDPDRHGALAVDAADRFLPPLRELCPPEWTRERKEGVAELIFAALRGFLVQRRTGGGPDGGDGGEAGFSALLRMLAREEEAG
jgi:AcrR family transcriptional regulator